MGLYKIYVVPRVIDRLLGGEGMGRWRSKATSGLVGQVLEIGYGTGLNVAYYPPEVTGVFAVEPSRVAIAIASRRETRTDAKVEHVGPDGQYLPLADECCDSALCTFTLCSIPNVERAIREVHRVLKPGALFHFLEHGLAPDESVVAWQRRIDPWEQRLADGCSLVRDPIALVSASGFTMVTQKQRYAKGPKPWSYFSVGVARKY